MRVSRRSVRRACIVASLGMPLLPGYAGAQDGLEQQLTGNSSRAWTLQRFVQPAAPGTACPSGEIYTFAATHDVIVSRCEGERVVQSRHAWSISGPDGGDPRLTIAGMGTFLLRFHGPGVRPDRMRLRAIGSQPGNDQEFSLDED